MKVRPVVGCQLKAPVSGALARSPEAGDVLYSVLIIYPCYYRGDTFGLAYYRGDTFGLTKNEDLPQVSTLSKLRLHNLRSIVLCCALVTDAGSVSLQAGCEASRAAEDSTIHESAGETGQGGGLHCLSSRTWEEHPTALCGEALLLCHVVT